MNLNMKKNFLILFIGLVTIALNAKDFKGAEYRTKGAYLYGRFETKMKSPAKEGILASFFTYHEIAGIQDWNEIDIEILGRYKDDVQFNAITPNQINHVRHQFTPFDPSVDYHVYAFEWTPNYIAWFIDGTEVYRQTGEHIATMNKAQKIMMNIWNPAFVNWAGRWNPEILPAFAYYDYVSYYSYAPGTGNYGTGNNFKHEWTDNFDSWDQVRWEKATHTWSGNNCDFVTNNVVFNNGKMILCLTDAVFLGYQDKKAPFVLWGRMNDFNTVTVKFSEEIDSLTGTTKGNYIIPGATVSEVKFLGDRTTVQLKTTTIDTALENIVIGARIKDLYGNTMSTKSTPLFELKSLTYPIKINSGGPSVLGYLAEKEWNETTEYGYEDGTSTIFSSTLQINGTEEDAIYQSERHTLASTRVRVPNGVYKVRLMLAENYFTAPSQRIFDVFLEDSLIINNLDIYQAVGKNTALTKEYIIQINDGVVDLHFCAEVDNPILNGLYIEQISTGINESKVIEKKFELYQNYPNPFNGTTVIRYYLNDSKELRFQIYNTLGQIVYSENLSSKNTGNNEIVLNTNKLNLSSGVYFYSINGDDQKQIKKLILLK